VGGIDSNVAAGKACIAAQGLPDVVIANASISVEPTLPFWKI